MQTGNFRKALCTALLVAVSITTAAGQKISRADSATAIPTNTLLRIMRAEDERRWDLNVNVLLGAKYPITRKRAALALGRIGDERAGPALVEALQADTDQDVRQMAAFALGEIESPLGMDALISVLENTRESGEVRARAIEALGKIAAALPRTEEARRLSIGQVILNVLAAERKEGATTEAGVRNRELELLGLTAVLRARPADAGKVVVLFLSSADPRIRADAANTLARLRAKDGVDELRMLLVTDQSPIVRANAARALGAAEDEQAFDALLDRALHDDDLRVRVSAIRALGSLKDARAVEPLLKRASLLSDRNLRKRPAEVNEVLELATALGRIKQETSNQELRMWLKEMSESFDHAAPEVEVALARVWPAALVVGSSANLTKKKAQESLLLNWRSGSSRAQGLGEIANLPNAKDDNNLFGMLAKAILRDMLDYRKSRIRIKTLVHSEYAIPEVLRALAAFKPTDMGEVLRKYLRESDVIVRATAAELLGEQPPSESNTRALIEALPVALRDKDLNDAALSILDALGKQKTKEANDAIKTALDSSDHLIRRRAVALLKANGVGDFSNRIDTVKTRNTEADYSRAIARSGRKVTATVVTSKGAFTIEFLTEEAPLTVDNFVQLARKGYFNGQTVPRVVPNFVIQTGDPRGDQNGGPGYQIRCEINEVSYERGAVGMALSGKDTGGSQWFVTHSPQPHLDGGYTVFGRVIRGMDVVDNIARGDTILRVIVNER